MSKSKIEKIIKEEIERFVRSKKNILSEDGFQPRSSLKNFQRQRTSGIAGILGKGSHEPSTPMEQKGGYNPPEVDQYDPLYEGKETDHFDRGYSNLDENAIRVEDDRRRITAEAHTLLNTSKARSCSEKQGSSQQWHLEQDGWYYGKYPLRSEDEVSWDGILEELKEKGPVLPIKIQVDENGEAQIEEGEYGIGAYEVLGIPKIPTHVKWYGNVQGTEKDELKEYFKRAFYPKNAESLDHYFDEVSGMNFMSDGKRVNWVDDNEDIPLSPAEAFRTGEYEEKSPSQF